MSRITAFTLSTSLSFALTAGTALAQSYGAMDAPATQARTALTVKPGRVIDVQNVQLDVAPNPSHQALGGILGASAGAFLAREAGWQGQFLGGAVGAAAGAAAGNAMSADKRNAQQVIVQPEQGDAIAVIQEPGSAPLVVGQKVYLVGSGNNVRVVPAQP
jgi:outer membrane lipoprotein SlyB